MTDQIISRIQKNFLSKKCKFVTYKKIFPFNGLTDSKIKFLNEF